MSDGSITIDTSLDNSGIERDIEKTKQMLQNAGTAMGNQFQQIGNAAQNNMKVATQSVTNLENAVQQAANAAGQNLSQALEQSAQSTNQSMNEVGNSLQTVAQQAEKAGEQAAKSITVIDVTATGMTTRVIQAGEELSQSVGNSLGDLGDTINDDVIEPLDSLGDTLGGLDDSIEEPIDGLREPIDGLGDDIDGLADGLDGLADSVDGMDNGTKSIEAVKKELEETEKSTKRVKEVFSKLGSHITDAMKKAGAAATAAFSVAMGAAVKVGMDFESGMSQVAATMGITTTEIASGSKEFEALSQAAKNAGATTQFSATQASEALNYLALASYDAEKSITALPTVLNLAAAGGIDLGYASDMVTDSMSALGLETNQLEGFVDQLAKTSQKSNTNIAQLGEGILTVGGTAKDLAGGTVELNTALGILADNGVKGAEGGTALRNVILSLSAPTDKAAKTLKDLGLEVFDANGKLRPLNETFKDLDGKLSQMSDKEKINVLNTLFNKVDLKSVNALLANSGERFDELSGYIRNSAGAAADMAETMNDNLKGKLTILGSALEGLGIEMYEEFEQPFKEAAETAIKSVDTISYSLKNGKLSESMQTVARAIGSMASKAAELAINALPKMIDGFAFLVDNAKILGTVLASTAGAVATFKGVMLFNDIQNSLKAATTAARMFGAGMTTSLTGMQAAVGVATGKLGIMQAAVAALGSPMGVAALAAAGVTAGIIALGVAASGAEKEVKKNREAIRELSKELESEKKAYEERQETIQKTIESSMYEINATEDLVDSITNSTDSIVDANGKVKKGYEDRARALADEINRVIPDAITLTEEEGDMYLKTADKLDVLINKKKIEAILEAKRENYVQAIQNREEHVRKLIDAENDLKKAEEDRAEAYDLLLNQQMSQEAYDKYVENVEMAKNTVEGLKDTVETDYAIIRENEELTAAALSDSIEEQTNVLDNFNTNIKKYNAEQIEEANKQAEAKEQYYNKLKELAQKEGSAITQAEVDEAKKAADEAKSVRDAAMQDLINQLPENIQKILESTKLGASDIVKGTSEELDKGKEDFKKSGENSGLGYAEGLRNENVKSQVTSAAQGLGNLAKNVLNAALDIHSPSKETEKSGKYFDEGLAIGIQENKGSVMESVEDLSQEALDIANKSSSDYKEIGELYGENYLSGLETMLDGTVELIEKNTDTMIKAYEKSMEEQLETITKDIEAQTDAKVEAIDDQISKLKDVKDKAQKEANKEEIKALEKQKKQIKEYSKERIQQIKDDAKEQTNAYKKGMQTLEKAGIDIIKKYNSDIEKEYQKRQDAIVEQYQSQKDEILSLQDSLYSKTSEYGELFHYDEETGEMLLNDLTKNTQAVEQYYNSLEELSNIEGISDGFVKMIATEYDVEEGTKLLNELLKMSDTRLQSYAAEWDKLQEVSSKGSQSFLEEELNVIDTSFNQAMEKLANDMPVFTKEALNNAINEIATIFPEKYAELIAIDPNFFDNMINTLNAEILGSISQKEGVVVPVKTEVGDIAQQVTEQTPAVQQAGSELTISIAETVENDGDEVVDAVDNVSKDSVQAMESYKPDFKEVGADYIDMLTEGMKSKWSTAVSVAGDIARSLKEELEEVASFSVKSNEEAMTARQLVESAEPSLLHSLYNDMLSAVEIQQSRVAAASASYITNNNQSSTVENNMGDINFNIAEVKGNSADRSVDKLMQQAEFYRRQRNLAVGVR